MSTPAATTPGHPGRARGLAALGAVLGGVLVLLPLPVLDVVMLVPVQLAIAVGVTWAMRKPLHFKSLAKFVLGWALVGGVAGIAVQICVPLIGKIFLLPPLSALWCYLLGEVTLFRSR